MAAWSKLDKSKLMHLLEAKSESSVTLLLEETTYIVDGNAHFQACVGLPDNFEELCLQLFTTLPKCPTIHFVTDTYKESSIKQAERSRRGSSMKHLIGPKTKLPSDFKVFLFNSDNKRQLIALILSEWQSAKYARNLFHRHVFFVCEETCCCLESTDGLTVSTTPVPNLFSSQEEADTRIILHCLFVAETSAEDPPNRCQVTRH